jgi:hypothetical protein
VQRIFREHHQIHRRQIAARFGDHRDDLLRLALKVSRRCDDGELKLDEADDHAVRRFVEAAQSVHGLSPPSATW